MSLRISLDRDLPVPIGVQLKGQIEYGIIAGELRPGEQLPSVRELAERMEIAQVTVSQVYAALKREGLIQMRPGIGTYVAVQGDGVAADDWTDVHQLVDAMIARALERGFSPAEINRVVAARLATVGTGGTGGTAGTTGTMGVVDDERGRRPRVAIVGIFDRATRSYAHDIAGLLADLHPQVTSSTMDRLRTGVSEDLEYARTADVVLTLANQIREVRRLLGDGHPPVHELTFVPHPTTVACLRALSADLRLGLVSTFAEFLPTMVQGVAACTRSRQAPLCTTLADVERLPVVLSQADVVVYASGSEKVLDALPDGKRAFEYLHTPERSSVNTVRPLLERVSGAWAHANGNRNGHGNGR